jgi:hypothetical protein
LFPREQRERGDHAMVPVTGEADAVVVSGPEQRRGRVMKNAIQKTECHELSDAELNTVVGGNSGLAGVAQAVVDAAKGSTGLPADNNFRNAFGKLLGTKFMNSPGGW